MKKPLSTRTKLQKLKDYVFRNHQKLRAVDPNNITGMGIGMKQVRGKTQRQYSIIFHVIKKTNEQAISQKEVIPKFLRIRFGANQSFRIKTDVIETGVFKLHIGVGALVNLMNANMGGSIGLYLRDQYQNVYGLTNYHVLGQNLMANGVYKYITDDLTVQNTQLGGVSANFYCGLLDGQNDSALVYLNANALQSLGMPSNSVNGSMISNQPANYYSVGDNVAVYGRLDYNKGSVINQIGCSKNDNDTKLQMSGLIALNKVTQPGDSGSLLIWRGASIMPLGLIVGADDVGNSYAIPLTTILPTLSNAFHLSLTII